MTKTSGWIPRLVKKDADRGPDSDVFKGDMALLFWPAWVRGDERLTRDDGGDSPLTEMSRLDMPSKWPWSVLMGSMRGRARPLVLRCISPWVSLDEVLLSLRWFWGNIVQVLGLSGFKQGLEGDREAFKYGGPKPSAIGTSLVCLRGDGVLSKGVNLAS
jgi:hypothetical protein